MPAVAFVRIRYGGVFLAALLTASFIPAIVSVINFDVLNGSAAIFVATFSLLSLLGGAHIWLTLAYYTQPKWVAHFNTAPLTFYAAPAIIMIVVTALMAQPYKPVGLASLYALTFLNLWHHSKQNWGILAIVGKIRHGQVAGLRKPIIYAWPFFIVPWLLWVPEISDFLGRDVIFACSVASGLFYLAFCTYCAAKDGFLANRDPIIILFGVALCSYFLPTFMLAGKPYAILVWASAHGLQYYLMVWASLSLRQRSTVKIINSVASAGVALVILAGLTLFSYATSQAISGDFWASFSTRLIFGVVGGVNLVHFWVDAFIWKFSNKAVRDLHGEAFAFG